MVVVVASSFVSSDSDLSLKSLHKKLIKLSRARFIVRLSWEVNRSVPMPFVLLALMTHFHKTQKLFSLRHFHSFWCFLWIYRLQSRVNWIARLRRSSLCACCIWLAIFYWNNFCLCYVNSTSRISKCQEWYWLSWVKGAYGVAKIRTTPDFSFNLITFWKGIGRAIQCMADWLSALLPGAWLKPSFFVIQNGMLRIIYKTKWIIMRHEIITIKISRGIECGERRKERIH